MEFTVTKSDLVRELSLSQGVVEKKTTIPILSNVLLEAAGDRVTLTATDLELGIRCSCPARVKKEGAGTVPARKLLDYVRLLPEGDVHMKFMENHWANITSGRSRTRIAGMSRESFPELPEMPEKIAELIKLADEGGEDATAVFAGDDNHLFFQVAHRLLITRKLTGNFPDYERVLPKDHVVTAKLQKDEIRSAIERVAQFADERSRAIRVQFTNGEVRVFSSSVETG